MFNFLKKPKVVTAGFDGESAGGTLNPQSQTWAFIVKWANNELNAAREKNDSLSHGVIETTVIRSRIALLKEILALPEGKPTATLKGLLATDFEDSDTYAGY